MPVRFRPWAAAQWSLRPILDLAIYKTTNKQYYARLKPIKAKKCPAQYKMKTYCKRGLK